MPRILRGQLFTRKHMTKMRVTGVAGNLDTATIGIGAPTHRARDFLIKARPAATGVKLAVGSIQRSEATSAHERSLLEEIVVFPCVGSFCALLFDDIFFVLGERLEVHGAIVSGMIFV